MSNKPQVTVLQTACDGTGEHSEPFQACQLATHRENRQSHIPESLCELGEDSSICMCSSPSSKVCSHLQLGPLQNAIGALWQNLGVRQPGACAALPLGPQSLQQEYRQHCPGICLRQLLSQGAALDGSVRREHQLLGHAQQVGALPDLLGGHQAPALEPTVAEGHLQTRCQL